MCVVPYEFVRVSGLPRKFASSRGARANPSYGGDCAYRVRGRCAAGDSFAINLFGVPSTSEQSRRDPQYFTAACDEAHRVFAKRITLSTECQWQLVLTVLWSTFPPKLQNSEYATKPACPCTLLYTGCSKYPID